jgi:hypothetical protein
VKKIPRASLSVDLLTDGCYGSLVGTRNGLQAFGVFVSLVVAGRERLLRGRASRVIGTDALRFDDDTSHICRLTHVTPKCFADAIVALTIVAESCGERPWVFVDDDNRLNIRSYFKFNDNDNWGGSRPGAGRSVQDGIKSNQVDSILGSPPSALALALDKNQAKTPSPPPTGGIVRDGRKLNLPDAWDGWRMPLHDLCNLHPFEWVQRAVDEYTGKDLGDPVRYLAKVLVSWKKNGGPPEVPPVRVANGTAAKHEKWDPEEQRAYYAARYEAQEAEAARKAGA